MPPQKRLFNRVGKGKAKFEGCTQIKVLAIKRSAVIERHVFACYAWDKVAEPFW